MKNLTIQFFCFFIIPLACSAQIGGNSTYEFLNLPTSARSAALGGAVVPVNERDINLAINNPSILDSSFDKDISLSAIHFISDINYGNVGYVRDYKKWGTFFGGVQFLHYGTFTQADAAGNESGNFTAGDYSLTIGWGRRLDSALSVGASIKNIFCDYHPYFSYGIAGDVYGTYTVKKFDAVFTAIVRNAGFQVVPFYSGNSEPLPLEIQFGFSKKLSKAPIRIIIIGQHLQVYDLSYKKPVDENAGTSFFITDNSTKKTDKISTFDNFARHIILGAEFLFSKNFQLRAGYNVERKRELAVEANPSLLDGLSLGFGLNIKRFSINYGWASYRSGFNVNTLSISTNLNYFRKTKRN